MLRSVCNEYVFLNRLFSGLRSLMSAGIAGLMRKLTAVLSIHSYALIRFRIPIQLHRVVQTGHCGLNGHLDRLNIKDSPFCQACGVTEDVKHFIMECLRYNQGREYLKQMCTSGDQLRLYDAVIKREFYIALGDFLMSTGRTI